MSNPPSTHPSTPNMKDLQVFMNEALQRTGQEISKRNIIKPPQIRGSKKMGPLKTRLSLKESINLMLDRGMEKEKSDTQVTAGKAVNYTIIPNYRLTVQSQNCS